VPVKAIYQNGVFKPIDAVGLAEGEWVELEIVHLPPKRSRKTVSLQGIWKEHVRLGDEGDWVSAAIAEIRGESAEKLKRLAQELSEKPARG
jgi:predicted DNA-binding antitoxin AbrB/MazE fold protein